MSGISKVDKNCGDLNWGWTYLRNVGSLLNWQDWLNLNNLSCIEPQWPDELHWTSTIWWIMLNLNDLMNFD